MTITITENDQGYKGIGRVETITIELKDCDDIDEVVRPILFALCTIGWEHESVVGAARKWAEDNTPGAT